MSKKNEDNYIDETTVENILVMLEAYREMIDQEVDRMYELRTENLTIRKAYIKSLMFALLFQTESSVQFIEKITNVTIRNKTVQLDDDN